MFTPHSQGNCFHETAKQWTCTAAWDIADEQLATLFGLNESKYEWAVREYYWQKRQEEEHSNQATQTTGLAVSLSLLGQHTAQALDWCDLLYAGTAHRY